MMYSYRTMGVIITLLLALLMWSSTRIGPDSAYPTKDTPGWPNLAVTQDTIKTTVCVAGYTTKIRPPVSYTNALKKKQMSAVGESDDPPSMYEEDHYISLEIGGNPTDPRNLWPQPYAGQYGARLKDQVEDALHKQLCAGKMTLKQVQECITSDWVACGKQLKLKGF